MGIAAGIDHVPDECRGLFAKNLKSFRVRLPGVADLLESHIPVGRLKRAGKDDWDVVFGDNSLYNGQGGKAFSEEQLDAFIKAPLRSLQVPPQTKTLDRHGGKLIADVVREASENDIAFLKKPNGAKGYFLFVLGLGLGLQLEALLEKTSAKMIVIIEPNIDFLFFSACVLDWEPIFNRAVGENYADIRFITQPPDPGAIASSMKALIRTTTPAAWDGALFYRHYSNQLLGDVMRIFNGEMLATSLLGLGFFEDELCMVRQTKANLCAEDRQLMPANPQGVIDVPVIIVGNAPSLDQSLDYIKANADGAIIVSCGSALPVLLENGIRPDFQIVLERGPFQFESCSRARDIAGLQGITLIASTTVMPDVVDLFDEVIFYLRPCLSSTPLFARSGDEVLSYTDPMAANAAFNFVLVAGFTEIYLVGVDMGSRRPDVDHSKNYVVPPGRDPVLKLDQKFPGNFGGEIYSEGVFAWSKEIMEHTVDRTGPGRKFFNCSDGALIAGFMPKHVSTLKFGPLAFTRSVIKKNLFDKSISYPAAEAEKRFGRQDLRSKVQDVIAECRVCVERDWDNDPSLAIRRLMRLMRPEEFSCPPEMVLRGSLTLMLAGLHYYAQRVRDADKIALYRDISKKHLLIGLDRFSIEIDEAFPA